MSTYTPIASVTLSSAQSSVTFSGIPQTYTDLVLVAAGTHTGSGVAGLYISSINGDTGSNYSRTLLQGNGSTASSARGSSETDLNIGLIGSSQANSIFHFMNYSNSTTNKTILARGNDASALVRAAVGLWRNTAAITSFTLSGVTFASGSTFNLYGVANASITNTAKATGGDTITTDGTYWYHTFYSSGTFTPTQNISADCLVVAGGGGGGANMGGGGGAGGLIAHTSQSLTATGYTITVGGGGAATSDNNAKGTNGSNSQFGSLTAGTGGGGGGSYFTPAGANGGSGGGGGSTDGSFGSSSGGTGSQGSNGAAGQQGAGTNLKGGGGGGYTSAGTSGASGAGGGGGSSGYSSWGSATNTGQNVSGTYYYAGGGGGGASSANTGGTGGNGGGGNGASNANAPVAGTANTGGGGGGGGNGQASGITSAAGGSGIVIVRYAV